MSTKIYNGYVLPKMSLDELQAFVMRVRTQMAKANDKETKSIVSLLVGVAVDKLAANLMHPFAQKGKSIYTATFLHLMEQESRVKKTQERDAFYDFTSSACFFPLKDKVLATFYGERKAFRKVWESQPEVKSYGYWDNTDKEDDVTDEEWMQRCKDWDEALPDVAIPALCGFTTEFTLRSSTVALNVDQIVKELKKSKFEDRVEGMAQEFLYSAYTEQYSTGIKGFSEYLNQHQAEFEEQKIKVAAILPKEITKDMIIGD